MSSLAAAGLLTEELQAFLEMSLPVGKGEKKKKAAVSLGVLEPKLGSAVQEATGIPCQSNDLVLEYTRGIRTHFAHFVSDLKDGDLEKAQLGLAHSYSRSKVKFNVNRVDNMIIQSISLLDTLDKDVNTFCMRVRSVTHPALPPPAPAPSPRPSRTLACMPSSCCRGARAGKEGRNGGARAGRMQGLGWQALPEARHCAEREHSAAL